VLDPATSQSTLDALRESLALSGDDMASALAAVSDAVVEACQIEKSLCRTGEGWSVVDTSSLVARIHLPTLERDRRLEAPELESSRLIYHNAQAMIRRHLPGLDEDRTALVRRIVPSHMRDGRLISSTSSDILGTIFVTHHQQPALVAEQIVHEVSHTRLFFLQMLDDLIQESYPNDSWIEARFYSPWRRDPRPINGILHGAFVFDAVAELWARILESPEAEEGIRSLGRRRLGQVVGQLQRARETLDREAALTPWGHAVVARLGGRLDERFLPIWDELRLGAEPVLDLDGVDGVQAGMTVATYLAFHAKRWREAHG
jgi:HEXXH motif-containing protein